MSMLGVKFRSIFSSGGESASNIFTFIIEGQQLQIETDFLLPCTYFNSLFLYEVEKTTTRTIQIDNVSKQTVEAFLNFLKTNELPKLELKQLIELYILAQKYEHHPLLNQARALVIESVPSCCAHILSFGCTYKDAKIKTACQEYLAQNASNEQAFLSRLIDEELYLVVDKLLSWQPTVPGSNWMASLLTYNQGPTPFAKLILKGKSLLASKLLKAGQAQGVPNSQIVPNPQEMILQMLQKENPPSYEQYELIGALAADDPTILHSGHNIENPPIFVALIKGWYEIFEAMLKFCKTSVALATNSKGVSVLGVAISLRRSSAIEGLKIAKITICQSEFSSYVLQAIQTKKLKLVKEVLSFPLQGGSITPTVNYDCIIESLATLDILKEVWPYFHGTPAEISAIRLEAFEQNAFTLATIVFTEGFDASDELFPKEGALYPWLHYAVLLKKMEWVVFLASRSKNKNASFAPPASNLPPMTPLLLALSKKHPSSFILKMLELGFDINEGNSVEYPIHLILGYEDPEFLKEAMRYKPKLNVLNERNENCLHLQCKRNLSLEPKELLSLLCSDRKLANQQDVDGNTPFHVALQRVAEKPGDHNALVLSYAVFSASTSVLWKPNEAKNVPFKTLSGPLFETVMRYFIDRIKQTEEQRLARALLIWCGQHYLYHFCEELIPLVQDIKTVVSENGKNLLHYASEIGAVKAAQKLVELRIPIDFQDHDNRTPLHYAVLGTHKALVDQLLKLGADVKKLDNSGQTPLALALQTDPRTEPMQEIIDLLETASCTVQ